MRGLNRDILALLSVESLHERRVWLLAGCCEETLCTELVPEPGLCTRSLPVGGMEGLLCVSLLISLILADELGQEHTVL